jgi:hypothetical protein
MSKANEMASKAENETIVALCPYKSLKGNNNKVKKDRKPRIDSLLIN